MLSPKFLTKNGVIWSVPKYVITNLKINNSKEKNHHEYSVFIFLSQTNLDEHASAKIKIQLELTGGFWGASPPEAEEIFKKSNKMEAFPYFFPF